LETQLNEMRQQMDMLVKGRNQAGSKPAETQDSFDAQFAKIQEKLEEGEISVSEAMAKQRELIEENSKSTMQQLLQEQARETEVKQIQSKFFQENQDFVELRDSGELQKIIDSNPLHDPLSAYYAHKAQQSTKAIEEAVTKAVKETEDRLRKEFTSKRNAASLGSGAAHVPNRNESPELNDPNKFGGKTAVLANRLRAMRQGI
jgi:hypothetical protein